MAALLATESLRKRYVGLLADDGVAITPQAGSAALISSPYQNAYRFLLVLIVLLVRPYGLFGERGREA